MEEAGAENGRAGEQESGCGERESGAENGRASEQEKIQGIEVFDADLSVLIERLFFGP